MPTKIFPDFYPYKQTRIITKKTAYTHQKITKKSATILACVIGQKSGKILGERMTSSIQSEFN
jgi:hypothetical protein